MKERRYCEPESEQGLSRQSHTVSSDTSLYVGENGVWRRNYPNMVLNPRARRDLVAELATDSVKPVELTLTWEFGLWGNKRDGVCVG